MDFRAAEFRASRRPVRLPLAIPLACVAAAACSHAKVEATPDAAAPEVVDAAPDVALDAPDEASVDAGRGQPTKLAVTSFQTSVIDRPQWPESGGGAKRLGYLRQGSAVEAYEKPVVNDDCKDGWYELVTGGFVCGKAVTTEMSSAKVRLAPHQPDRDAGMPYRYGVNVQAGTPLYRRVLSVEDRKKFEPDLAPPKPAAHEESGGEGEEAAQPEEKEKEPANAKKERDAGADAGKPKLKELKGRGVLVRKMERGFYVALDKDFRAAGAHWWRTTFGFATPFERIAVQQSQTKHAGSWFDMAPIDAEPEDGGVAMPGAVGFVTFASQKLAIEDGKVKWGPELPKRSAVMLTGRTQVVSGVTYHEASGGFWVRVGDLKLAKPAPPADLGDKEKWIDVDLTRQTLIAFEGKRPMFATLISSGRRNPYDKEHDFPTPTGTFHILEKHVTTTMDGDVASDGPYSIEDVPWVMYFQGSYALHGAFWHDAFGHPRSHGCVNMAPDDARNLFSWADPQLPPGWHGVVARSDKDGTRLVIHEDPPPGKTKKHD
jgi:lipoprotein-anchoring transpeptidase ErfK/SrfK